MASLSESGNAGENATRQGQPEKHHQPGEDGHHPHAQPEHRRDCQQAGDDQRPGQDHAKDYRQHETGAVDASPANRAPELMLRPAKALNLNVQPGSMPVPPAPKRLPRYKRAPREVDFALTQRDLAIMKTVTDFRLASSAHLQALAGGSNQGILRRLQKLYHAGLLDRLSPRTCYGEGSAKMVYAITNQ